MSVVHNPLECAKCGHPKVQEENNSPRCFRCDPPPPRHLGRVSQVEDPGHEKMVAMLKGTGVPVPKPLTLPKNGNSPMQVAQAQIIPASLPAGGTFAVRIEFALGILRSLPMPADIKQYKVINRVIKSLEKVITEDTNG